MITTLPRELQLKIFGYCYIGDLKNISLTSKVFHNAVCPTLHQFIRIPTLHLLNKNITNKNLLNLRYAKNIRLCNIGCSYYSFANSRRRKEKISFMQVALKYKQILKYCDPCVMEISCYFPRSAFRVLVTYFHNMRELHVTGVGSNMDDDILCNLSENLPRLKLLNISNSKIKDGGLLRLECLVSLEVLDTSGCVLTDAGLVHIGRVEHLKRLNVRNCPKITDEGIRALAAICKMQDLRVSGCFQITDHSLYTISGFQLLENLDISRCRDISNCGVSFIGRLKMLRSLNMSWCRRVTDEGVMSLGVLKMLENLDMTGTDTTDTTIMFLAQFPSLKVLHVTATDVSNAALQYISSMNKLSTFSWVYTKITEEGLLGNNLSHFI